MKFRLYRQFGALNSRPIFDAFEKGIKHLGHQSVDQGEDIAVIWSVLWNGRMANNRNVYFGCLQKKIPVMIIEVGNLLRNQSWRISLDNINAAGKFAADADIDSTRLSKFNLDFFSIKENRSPAILIASQHERSLQWEGMPPMAEWVNRTIYSIRKFTDRPIVLRPHPRCIVKIPGVEIQMPIQVPGTYDSFDLQFDYHCVINHNSGPAIHAAMAGTPVICDVSSLAYPVSDKIENIETPVLPDRTDWAIRLANTEWFVDEIAQGIPQQRLISLL